MTLITLVLTTIMVIVGLYYLKEWLKNRKKLKKGKEVEVSKPSLWQKIKNKFSKKQTVENNINEPQSVETKETEIVEEPVKSIKVKVKTTSAKTKNTTKKKTT